MLPAPRRAAPVDQPVQPTVIALPDDPSLVARVRAGDAAAFEAMFHAYYDALCSVVQGIVRADAVAEEIVDDVFLGLWAQRERWAVRDSVRTYLFGAARNGALNWVKHHRIVERAHAAWDRTGAVPGAGAPSEWADSQVRRRDLGVAVAAAVAALPERARTVLVLHRQHGLSMPEVGRVMGISPRTAEVHLTRALRTLRRELSGFLVLVPVLLPMFFRR